MLGNMLQERELIRPDWEQEDFEAVVIEGRPPEQQALIRAWVRAQTACDHAYRGNRTKRSRDLDRAVAEVAQAARLISSAHKGLIRYAEAPEAFMDSEDIHRAKEKVEALGFYADYADRFAAFMKNNRGVPRIADAVDFHEFTSELCLLLPDYEMTDRDIARVICGSVTDQAVRRVRSKRRRLKAKRRKESK